MKYKILKISIFLLGCVLAFLSGMTQAFAMTDLITGGSVACSSYYAPAPFPCSNSVDKDTETRWALNNEAGGTWTYNLGTTKTINYLVIDKDNGNTEFTSAYLKGSSNGVDWIDITTLNMTASSTEYFSFTNTTAYQFYRLVQLTCSSRGDYICGFDDIWGYYTGSDEEEVASTTPLYVLSDMSDFASTTFESSVGWSFTSLSNWATEMVQIILGVGLSLMGGLLPLIVGIFLVIAVSVFIFQAFRFFNY